MTSIRVCAAPSMAWLRMEIWWCALNQSPSSPDDEARAKASAKPGKVAFPELLEAQITCLETTVGNTMQ